MLNYELLIYFTLYLIALFIGFNRAKHNKDEHNKKYHKWKTFLSYQIMIIFLISVIILTLLAQEIFLAKILFVTNTGFLLYYYAFICKQTRCWKQHRMIIYNFLLIPIFYFASVALENPHINLLNIFIYVYTICEFQFAKFKLFFKGFWD